VIYRVRHVTEYLYSEPVPTSHHELHLLPRARLGQIVLAESLVTNPAPAVRRDRLDWFGNRSTHLAFHERHKRLEVATDLRIDLDPPPAPADDTPWEATRDQLQAATDPDARAAIEFRLRSPRAAPSAAARELAMRVFAPGVPLATAARALTRLIHDEFTYDPEATDVATSVDEVLKHGRGVCQDFAHVQIACLRSLGLAARYVSGYLVTRPTGEENFVGADASHAWLSVRLANGAWLDLDPTNDVVPSDRHIEIAIGRDFGDVTPMRGVILGGGRHDLRVGVDVSSLVPGSEVTVRLPGAG
jgi:transglutaminase-like putative cysteine protease